MNFLSRFQQKESQQPQSYSLIDVGRDTVKAVVVLILPDTLEPQIVGYGLAETGGHDVTGGRLQANAVTRPVNSALTQAEDSAKRYLGRKIVPDDVIFVLAGRATIGKLTIVKQARPKPDQPITEKELNTLTRKAERLVRQELMRDSEGGQWQPLAVTDAGTRIDDHLVLEGVGLTGQELSVSVFGTAGQAGALRALEVLANRLDLSVATIVTAPQALASTILHTEAIVLDIGFSGTDISLIRSDALVATDWIPFGGYFFTHRLARHLNLSVEEAGEHKHSFANGALSTADAAHIDDFLEPVRERWYNSVMEVLQEFSPYKALPRRIYLTGGASLLPGLDRWLRTTAEPFASAPEIYSIGKQTFSYLQNLTDLVDYHLFALTLSAVIGIPEQ